MIVSTGSMRAAGALAMLLNAAQVPPPPPVVGSSSAVAPTKPTRLLRWLPGVAQCGEATPVAVTLRRPYTALLMPGMLEPAPQTYRFRIDGDGRPLSITRTTQGWTIGSDDLAPALAASRFAPGRARATCEISFIADTPPLAEAPFEDVISYSLMPTGGRLPKEGWDRIRPTGTDCDREPRPGWQVAVSPEFDRLPGTPGVRDWTMVGYDLDAARRPVRVHPVAGTHNAALDRAAQQAIDRSRSFYGPRRGCLWPFSKNASRLAPPADIDLGPLRPQGATCPEDRNWVRTPALTFPENWRRRAIEGWAIVTYDIAPWGEIGNLRVLASEPAAEFGDRAKTVMAGARMPAAASGYVGCIQRVRFRMSDWTPEADPRRNLQR